MRGRKSEFTSKKVWQRIFPIRVGDRVRIINIQGETDQPMVGKEGIVETIFPPAHIFTIYVRMIDTDLENPIFHFKESELERIEN